MVTASGELAGFDGPFYSADGEAWSRWWLSEDLPKLAKVVVTRKDVAPREVVIAYDEFKPGDDDKDEHRDRWVEKPMISFGAAIERHAFRVVFGDILESLFAPRAATTGPYSKDTAEPAVTSWEPVENARDWVEEIAVAGDARLGELHVEARAAGALKDAALLQAFTERKLALAARPMPSSTPPDSTNPTRPATPAIIPKMRSKQEPQHPVESRPAGQGQRRRRGKR